MFPAAVSTVMNGKWNLVLLLVLGAVLLAPAALSPEGNVAFGATNPQPVPVATFYDPDGVVGDNFGANVALSADGSEALIGASGSSESGIADVGKAYIYTRTNGTWQTIPTVTFIDPSLQSNDSFGGAFALSADGTTALFTTCSGVVYVYSRINEIWQTASVATLHDPGSGNAGCSGDAFGSVLALSADGNTALVNAPVASVNGVAQAGIVYVFTRNNGVWSPTPAAVFTDPGVVQWDMFGSSIALSADGTVALIGTNHVSGSDRVFVFTQTAGSWNTTPSAQINIPPDGGLGAFVSLSSNADTALIGLPTMNRGAGAVYVYTATNGTWSATPAAIFSDPPGEDVFGIGSVLSGNGSVAIVDPGNAYIFVREGGSWSPQAVTVIMPQPPTANFCGQYGINDVALSQAGNELLAGATEDPSAQVNPPPCSPGQVDGAVGRAYIYETSTNWINPTPPGSPPGNSGGSGGGSFGWLMVIWFSGLVLRRRLVGPTARTRN